MKKKQCSVPGDGYVLISVLKPLLTKTMYGQGNPKQHTKEKRIIGYWCGVCYKNNDMLVLYVSVTN